MAASRLQHSIEQLPGLLAAKAALAWECIREHNDTGEVVQQWSPETCRIFSRLIACSDYAAAVGLRHWQWLVDAIATGALAAPPQPGFALAPDETREAVAKNLLRVYRHKTLLHILWREYACTATLTETLKSLSSLADELVIASCDFANRIMRSRCGVPIDNSGQPVSLIVLAMGKLGGSELNLSSDIDVIFLYPEDGQTKGPHELTAREYFTRSAQYIVHLLGDTTEDGFVYRVDTRLRPFGESGPLVVNFSGLESYLLQHGRNWERYAYIKARMVGERHEREIVSGLMQELIEPFVYRRYLDFGVFESLRNMHATITVEVRRKDLAANIKRGPGGIREIEFIVQSMQLVLGGNNGSLRQPRLEAALQELDRSRALPAETVKELLAAYRFLRRLENFLQAIRDQQTHDLPTDKIDRSRLAVAMQYENWNALEAVLSAHRGRVSHCFREVVFRQVTNIRPVATDNPFSELWEAGAEEERWRELLNAEGFQSSDKLADEIVAFSRRVQMQQIDSPARQRLRTFVPELMIALRNRVSPEITLWRVLNIIDKVLRRSAYIVLLNENQTALYRLVDLCERSAYLADEIARFPLLLDEMLDPRLFTSVASAAEMRADLTVRLQQAPSPDSERLVEVLGRYQRAAKFRIAIADFSGILPVMKVSDALTELAEIVLARSLDIAWKDLISKHGAPSFVAAGEHHRAGFGVIAYGKLAGMELSYESDLDLVFLHNSRGDAQHTDGAMLLDNSVFFARLAQRLVHFLTTQTGSGALYDVDTRLRPSGRSGLLVTTVDAFRRYQMENAWTWEHQALLRSRLVAGNIDVRRAFEHIRAETLRSRVDRAMLAANVKSMRARMRRELDKSSKHLLDIKQTPGNCGSGVYCPVPGVASCSEQCRGDLLS